MSDTTFDESYEESRGAFPGTQDELLTTIRKGGIWHHRATDRALVSDSIATWTLTPEQFATLRTSGAIVKDANGLSDETDIWTRMA